MWTFLMKLLNILDNSNRSKHTETEFNLYFLAIVCMFLNMADSIFLVWCLLIFVTYSWNSPVKNKIKMSLTDSEFWFYAVCLCPFFIKFYGSCESNLFSAVYLSLCRGAWRLNWTIQSVESATLSSLKYHIMLGF